MNSLRYKKQKFVNQQEAVLLSDIPETDLV